MTPPTPARIRTHEATPPASSSTPNDGVGLGDGWLAGDAVGVREGWLVGDAVSKGAG
jgi:hypothetical protein